MSAKNHDLTNYGWEALYGAVDNERFCSEEAQLIYNTLNEKLRAIPFGAYLKRYIAQKADLGDNYEEIPLDDYKQIIKDSFKDNCTPKAFPFEETSAKIGALIKNWLTQYTVSRSTVLLLGFGLNMSYEDVNEFLTKALFEYALNPKNPFEVICYYCYKNHYNYLKLEDLWGKYEALSASKAYTQVTGNEYTVNVRDTMYGIKDEKSLLEFLSGLKTFDKQSKFSITAKSQFDRLYSKAKELIAKIYNETEEEKYERIIIEKRRQYSDNDRLYDYEKNQRIEKIKSARHIFTAEEITESDIEKIICSAIPLDKHGNLTPAKKSKLNKQLSGKRFSRQRINKIVNGEIPVDRFDLITLNFFIHSQQLDNSRNNNERYWRFLDETNKILNVCSMGELYIQNPYECFLLMCILSEEPLSTYSDVIEMAYIE